MSGEKKPRAWTGIWIALIVLVVVVVSFMLPPSSRVRETPLMANLDALMRVGKALQLYAHDNQGRRPNTLDELVPAYCAKELLSHLYPGHDEPLKWVYYPGHTEQDADEIVIATSPVDRRGKWVVLLNDLSGRVMLDAEFKRLGSNGVLRVPTPSKPAN
ncbi:MAG: hypothetical protein ABMA01_20885 [Chthoniobacteraceae bacterium]